jgi:hypothetical protein
MRASSSFVAPTLVLPFRDQKKARNANPAISAVFPVFWLVYHAQFILKFVVTDPSKYIIHGKLLERCQTNGFSRQFPMVWLKLGKTQDAHSFSWSRINHHFQHFPPGVKRSAIAFYAFDNFRYVICVPKRNGIELFLCYSINLLCF